LSSGTTLGGTGTVGATTSNSATITPGNGGVGTLTVSGNLTFNGASNVLIHAAPLSASKIAVSGTAVLTGTTLTVSPQPGFYGLTTSYTILTSAGLGGTQFNSPALSTNSNFIPTLSYAGGNNVLLTLKVLNPFFEFPFGNRNEESVGNNIAALNEAGELPAGLASLLGLLVGQSDATINEALDQLHPAPYSAFTEFQEEVGAKLISLFHRKPYLPYVYLDSTRVWVTPFGDSLTEKHHGEEFGFTANSGGVAFGVDGDLTPYWDLGFGGAWNYGQLEWHARHGHGEVNGFYGSVYTDYLVSNFYIGAAVYGGIDFYDTERHIRIVTIDDKAKANFRGYDIVAQLATAYYFGAPTAYFYPYANFDYLYCHTPGFTEHGADSLDLDVGSNHASTFRTEMGLALQLIDLNYDETMGITPLFSIGWVNMCPIERQNYHSFFVGAPIPFTTFGWDETWNLFSLDFGLGFFYQAFSIDVEYNCEMSADKETLLYNHYGNICFEWEW
ncbi:MAG TPA: autotransporter outer membrane beta-barrel domain-containing protein, partial [Chlamydiales bacterium]|nr:autotransporter outer membrane beta-barrel domain-containing protein [Chlamydiales bacterium]